MSRHRADVTTDVRRSVCLGAWAPGQPGQAVECWDENQKSRADFNNLRGNLQKIMYSLGVIKQNWFAKCWFLYRNIRNQMPSLGM